MRSKRKWSTPALIVLEKGKPEEAVLLACKGDGATQGPNQVGASCKVQKNLGCSVVAPS